MADTARTQQNVMREAWNPEGLRGLGRSRWEDAAFNLEFTNEKPDPRQAAWPVTISTEGGSIVKAKDLEIQNAIRDTQRQYHRMLVSSGRYAHRKSTKTLRTGLSYRQRQARGRAARKQAA